MNALVTLLEPPYADLTYSLPKAFPENFWKEGLRVAVPLGRGPLRPGLVRSLNVEAPQGVRLRDIAFPLEVVPILNPGLVRILEAVASRQCLTVGLAISQLVPLTRDMGVRVRRLDIKGREGTLSLKQAAALGPGEKKALVQDNVARELKTNLVFSGKDEICVFLELGCAHRKMYGIHCVRPCSFKAVQKRTKGAVPLARKGKGAVELGLYPGHQGY